MEIDTSFEPIGFGGFVDTPDQNYSDYPSRSSIGSSTDGFQSSTTASRKHSNNVGNVELSQRRGLPVLTRFERAKLLSQRAEQLASGSAATFRNNGEFESPVDIAQEELRRRVIPFFVIRVFPDGSQEKWNVKEFLWV